jgi:hypothetical protein
MSSGSSGKLPRQTLVYAVNPPAPARFLLGNYHGGKGIKVYAEALGLDLLQRSEVYPSYFSPTFIDHNIIALISTVKKNFLAVAHRVSVSVAW